MSLSSLPSAAQSAEDDDDEDSEFIELSKSNADIVDVEEIRPATRAALEAAKLAQDLEQNLEISSKGQESAESIPQHSEEVNNNAANEKVKIKKKKRAKQRSCPHCYMPTNLCLDKKLVLKGAKNARKRVRARTGSKKIGWITGGDNRNVYIRWQSRHQGKVESFRLMSGGEFAFQFWCSNSSPVEAAMPPPEEVKPKRVRRLHHCQYCGQSKNTCLHGKTLTHVQNNTLGRLVIFWILYYNKCFLSVGMRIKSKDDKLGLVVGGEKGNVIVRWESGEINSQSIELYALKFWCLKESTEGIFHKSIPEQKNLKKLRAILQGKCVLKVKDYFRGLAVQTHGESWPKLMMNKSGWIAGGDDKNVDIRWESPYQGKIESYSLVAGGESTFQFCCKDVLPAIETSL